ncbi:hypothetical protein SAMN05216223_116129 [Actinacidiphila yanglinensis]|uniref:Uncharacterized protein n=1 Tax=Actinacidiphila yanglinensis TaxID=310779 RepID=A0A1H6DKT2_9ACTN|nr:hypothetical protein SAMN05216223_116129 [Actinacidiphila yanglinensis]
MIRHWKIALIVGWTGIAVLVALALGCGLVIGLAFASQPPAP